MDDDIFANLSLLITCDEYVYKVTLVGYWVFGYAVYKKTLDPYERGGVL